MPEPKPPLFDAHAHLDFDDFHRETDAVLARAREAGLVGIVNVGAGRGLDGLAAAVALAARHPDVWAAVGVHPHDARLLDAAALDLVRDLARRPRVVAIGEIGLDYYRKFGDRDSQVELFIRQLELAEKLSLPVIIHNRDAGSDVLEILRERLPKRGGILHCYSEDYEYAKKALDLNLWISFAGNVTYRNARNLQDTAKKIPVERMLIESEAPFMVPAIHRGKRNKPSYINETAAFIAQLRELPMEDLTEVLYANSLTVFGLS